jgi:hypothetical protein
MASIEELHDCGRLLDRQVNFGVKKNRAENRPVLRPIEKNN